MDDLTPEHDPEQQHDGEDLDRCTSISPVLGVTAGPPLGPPLYAIYLGPGSPIKLQGSGAPRIDTYQTTIDLRVPSYLMKLWSDCAFRTRCNADAFRFFRRPRRHSSRRVRLRMCPRRYSRSKVSTAAMKLSPSLARARIMRCKMAVMRQGRIGLLLRPREFCDVKQCDALSPR
jgi:hypothetical protein